MTPRYENTSGCALPNFVRMSGKERGHHFQGAALYVARVKHDKFNSFKS